MPVPPEIREAVNEVVNAAMDQHLAILKWFLGVAGSLFVVVWGVVQKLVGHSVASEIKLIVSEIKVEREAREKLESAMTTLEERTDNHGREVETIDVRVAAAEGQITELQHETKDAGGRIIALETRVNMSAAKN